MYVETRRTLHEGSNYRLTAVLTQQQSMRIELFSIRKGFIQQAFAAEYRFEDFPSLLKKSFANMENILSFISDPSHCRINLKEGIVGLRTMLKLKNGEIMQLSSGQLILQQRPYQVNEFVQEIVTTISDKHQLPSLQIKNVLQLLTQALCALTQDFKQFKESKKNKEKRHTSNPSQDKMQQNNELQKSQQILTVSEETRQKKQRQPNSIQHKVQQDGNSRFLPSSQEICFDDSNKLDYCKKIDALQKNVDTNNQKMKQVELKIKQIEESCEKCVGMLKKCSQKILKENENMENKRQINIRVNSPSQKYFKKNKYYGEYSVVSLDEKAALTQEEGDNRQENDEKEHEESNQSDHIDMTGAYINQFRVYNNIATYIGQDWTKTQLLGKVSTFEQNQFKIRIRKTKRRYIWLGVVDSTYKDRRWSWGQPNWVYYCGWNGKIYEGPDQSIKIEGNGFKERQTVTVHVEQEQGKIYWKVNDAVRAFHFSDKLKNKGVTWVPLIKFFDNGDMVEWIEK